MKRLNVLISGWYGFGNMGDEAILYAMKTSLAEAAPGSKLSVLSFSPNHTRSFHQMEAFHQLPSGAKGWARSLLRGQAFEAIKAIAASDILLLGGGGFLSDWQPDAPWTWLRQALIAKCLGKPVMLFGVGAGPFLTAKGKWITRTLIRMGVDLVTVRDPVSKDWLNAAGVPAARIKVASDPVFGCGSERQLAGHLTGRIGISATPLFHLEKFWPGQGARYQNLLSELTKTCRMLKDRGFTPVFLPMHQESDLEVARAIETRCPGVLQTTPGATSIMEAMNAVRSCDVVVAMRLHAGILAAIQGVPPIGIIYHPKVAAFLDLIGMRPFAQEVGDGRNWAESSLSADSLVASIEAVLQNRARLVQTIQTRIQPLGALARSLATEALALAGRK